MNVKRKLFMIHFSEYYSCSSRSSVIIVNGLFFLYVQGEYYSDN